MDLNNYKNLYGLIGEQLSYSFSKKYFGEKFAKEKRTNSFYELFPMSAIAEIDKLIDRYPNLRGLNVTIPYKEQVFDFLDEINPDAAEIGAVNTIRFIDGKRVGYNTDHYGFQRSLLEMVPGGEKLPTRALVLGTGGAAKAITYVLKKEGIDFLYVSRTAGGNKITYEDLRESTIKDHSLIINTTPLGTYPNVADSPNLPYKALGEEHYLYDLVYNPAETTFLAQGRKVGAKTSNGLKMLSLQAEKSWEIWNKGK